MSGSLQILQQNLTVSHQFNLCHKLARKYYKKSHASRFTAHHMAIFRAISQACGYITKFSVTCPVSDTFPKVASYLAYQNSIIKKCTVWFLKYKRLKLKLRVFLAGHSVAMVTYCVTKIIPTCSQVIGQFFYTMIVASIDKE